MNSHDATAEQFFDVITADYTEMIERCFPRYREMLWALTDYLPRRAHKSILELGAGTGNLSLLLRKFYPDARLELVDISGESLNVCRDRIGSGHETRFTQQDFRNLTYESGQFDLIVSSIAVHHCTSPEKRALFAQGYDWLASGGTFAFADQFRGINDSIYDRHIKNWQQQSLAAGSTQTEFDMWMKHQADHDFHDPLTDQMAWLSESGFANVDCVWRYLLWSVVIASKP